MTHRIMESVPRKVKAVSEMILQDTEIVTSLTDRERDYVAEVISETKNRKH